MSVLVEQEGKIETQTNAQDHVNRDVIIMQMPERTLPRLENSHEIRFLNASGEVIAKTEGIPPMVQWLKGR